MKYLFKNEEIKALGFAWPHPDVPGQYLVMEKNDMINLKESIEKLKQQISADEKILSGAYSFRSRYGGQMSVLEYSDYKDSYDVNRERLNLCKKALRVLETILERSNSG